MIAARYRVERLIGEGGMGRVYLAEQQMGTATRPVAVKVLVETDPTMRARFYRECELVIRLTHPNTIQFYDFGELPDGRLYIVMELIEGESLARAMEAGPMARERVERIVEQICGSLQEAHELGIVHRDLKPENILLTVRGGEPDFVKVCDFGIAKTPNADASQLTLQGTIVGTPRYMSPEQLTGGTVDARSDLYSLGLILYEMLTGSPPFQANTPLEWAARHTTADPPPLEGFPATRDLEPHRAQAVMAALGKLPSDRPHSARELAALFAGRDPRAAPASARPPPRAPRPPGSPIDATAPTLRASPIARKAAGDAVLRPRRRASIVAIVLAAFGVGAAVAAAFVALTPHPPAPLAARDASVVEPDAGSEGRPELVEPDAGPLQPSLWFRIVHFENSVRDPALALGAPDQRYAVLPRGGTLTLELEAGVQLRSDGGPGPDLSIRIDDARSGPYRADVGVARNTFTTVASDLVGSIGLDVDQFGLTQIRYVRLKNRSTSSSLYVDAVGAYRSIAAQ
ncbi:MAG: serine/threonine protein kinase [Sandaracinaceae bacterium]|nr:serine/threonine protein kinase [Sandaracinaceae bacterium]